MVGKVYFIATLFIIFVGYVQSEKASGSKVLAPTGVGENSMDQLVAMKAPFQLSYSVQVQQANERIDIYLVDDYNYQKITNLEFNDAQYVVGASAINTGTAKITNFNVQGTKQFHLVVVNKSEKNQVGIDYDVDAEPGDGKLSGGAIAAVVLLCLGAGFGVVSILLFLVKRTRRQRVYEEIKEFFDARSTQPTEKTDSAQPKSYQLKDISRDSTEYETI